MKKLHYCVVCIALIMAAVPNTACNSSNGTNTPALEPDNSISYWETDFENMFFNSIAVDKDGNVYIAGGKSDSNAWVVKKFDEHGIEDTANWDKAIPTGDGYGYAQSVATDIYGNVYVAGTGTNLISNTSSIDWWIKKFDSNGVEDVQGWDKKFNGSGGEGMLHGGPDLIYSLTTDSSGNVYAAGKGYDLVVNAITGGESGYDWWVKKFDTNGVEDTVGWDKRIDGNKGWDSANSIAAASDGSVFVVGVMSEPYPNEPGGDYWWIKKFDADGVEDAVYWNKKIHANYYGEARSVVIAEDGGIYVSGYGNNLVGSESRYDWWIKKFNGSGIEDTANWDKKIDNNNGYAVVKGFQHNKSDSPYSSVMNGYGNLYVVGYGTTNTNNTLSWYVEGWIKKYSGSGIEDTVNWDKKIDILQNGEYFSSEVKAVAVDADASVYITGTKGGKSFIKKYNSNGGGR